MCYILSCLTSLSMIVHNHICDDMFFHCRPMDDAYRYHCRPIDDAYMYDHICLVGIAWLPIVLRLLFGYWEHCLHPSVDIATWRWEHCLCHWYWDGIIVSIAGSTAVASFASGSEGKVCPMLGRRHHRGDSHDHLFIRTLFLLCHVFYLNHTCFALIMIHVMFTQIPLYTTLKSYQQLC